ncbi:prepilin-type N-terminal cleavage/methylation domain-containing protein [Algisphaera agarilytica]|uniref:Tfp pilus assembly protein PilV n=1 Tax=Algisphaera agarilytica TaxID=1385975 RepID=A0A7X0H5X0_9BACT|nr:prepilin-type N-terminal cleavage/methylation domain-containing protein [Algisphaera agarilytica]MBB6429896.1 Tfp pilus assembly protein PilV [Algisphaera agarilytica]
MRKHATSRSRGFTIVESLIAGVILALFAAALAGTTAQSSRAALRAQDHRKAAEWLDTVFNRIDMIGPARLASEGPVQGALDDRFNWSLSLDNDALYPDLYLVSVVISYTGADGRPARVEGHTQIHDPVGRRLVVARWEDL